jgi:uncharacterized protein (DUF1697 family)
MALLRGVNVGKAKRIPMAELRVLLEDLELTDVRTLLNSGNAIFSSARPYVTRLATAISDAIAKRFGFGVPVIVITATDLNTIVGGNVLTDGKAEPSKLLVAFVASATVLTQVRPLLAQSWTPEKLHVGRKAAYLWCAHGVIESKLMQAFTRATGDAATTRNWTTVLKLQAATQGHIDV